MRFTKEEKETIDGFIQKKKLSYSEFIHEAVFSYLNNIETRKNKINIKRICSNIQRFETILPNLVKDIHKLYQEFEDFKLNKDVYFII